MKKTSYIKIFSFNFIIIFFLTTLFIVDTITNSPGYGSSADMWSLIAIIYWIIIASFFNIIFSVIIMFFYKKNYEKAFRFNYIVIILLFIILMLIIPAKQNHDKEQSAKKEAERNAKYAEIINNMRVKDYPLFKKIKSNGTFEECYNLSVLKQNECFVYFALKEKNVELCQLADEKIKRISGLTFSGRSLTNDCIRDLSTNSNESLSKTNYLVVK